jgi:hypothetical protein
MKGIELILEGASSDVGMLVRPVTREMVFTRTVELASSAGRSSNQIKQIDYERANRELTGEADFDRQQAVLDFQRILLA